MVVNLNRKQVENIVDEILNRGRRIPRGPLTLVDVLLMNAFERSEQYSQLMNPGRTIEQIVEPVADLAKAKRKRKKSMYGKALSRELKALNKQFRTKKGTLRKGITQGNILKKAHRNVKRSIRKVKRR